MENTCMKAMYDTAGWKYNEIPPIINDHIPPKEEYQWLIDMEVKVITCTNIDVDDITLRGAAVLSIVTENKEKYYIMKDDERGPKIVHADRSHCLAVIPQTTDSMILSSPKKN